MFHIFKMPPLKERFFLILFSLCSLNISFAQIIVDQSDFMPVSRLFVMGFDTLPANVGNAGANQTWNFSSLQANLTDSMVTADPAWTPYPGLFPGSNVALLAPAGTFYYQYMRNDNTGFYLNGMVTTSGANPDLTTYTPPAKYFKWPMNYLDSFADSGVYVSVYTSVVPSGTDTSRYIRHYRDQNLVDGWGQIITPLGTFNCLRQKKTEQSTDSSFYYNSQFGTWSLTYTGTMSTITYDWLSDNASTGFMLASVVYSGQQYSGTYWLKGVATGMEELKNGTDVSLYPNPADDHLSIQFKEWGHYRVEIYNQVGARIMEETTFANEFLLDTRSFAGGLYIVKILDVDRGRTVSRKVLLAR